MPRAAAALAIVALATAAAAADPMAKFAPFANLTADIKAAVNNGGSPKVRRNVRGEKAEGKSMALQHSRLTRLPFPLSFNHQQSRILNGTKPTTAILDAINAKRTVIQSAAMSSIAAKVNSSAKATKAVSVLRNVTGAKEAALIAKLNATEASVQSTQAALLAKLNSTKVWG